MKLFAFAAASVGNVEAGKILLLTIFLRISFINFESHFYRNTVLRTVRSERISHTNFLRKITTFLLFFEDQNVIHLYILVYRSHCADLYEHDYSGEHHKVSTTSGNV